MQIIIKKDSNRFKPHYNRTMGKYYDSSKEYYADLKKNNLEPYDPSKVKRYQRKEYKPSQWARDVVRSVDRSGYVSGSVREELHKANIKKVPKDLMQQAKQKTPKGGWF
jgi:hypothetical protein